MKYVMFEHAGSGNHGCEAIVRSTISILGENNEYVLQTLNKKDDERFGLNEYAELIESDSAIINRNSLLGIGMRLRARMNSSLDYDVLESLHRHRRMLHKNAIALSIGGDNYCYAGIINTLRDKMTALKHKSIPTVLWGCSIESRFLDKLVINDIKKYDIITARESLTVDALSKIGVDDKIVPCSDPAFVLEKQEVTWKQDVFENNEVIGINVSDFMGYYNAYPNATYNNFKTLIEYLLKNTDFHIALIPHVRQTGNDDLIPSLQIASELESDRVHIVKENFNCMQLKYIISKCKMFIGCRTHSTIAAYSTCVPTLVVGYSVKAKGIAKDIFGDYSDLLVDAREFRSDNDLVNKFLEFSIRENELRNHLRLFMPEYANRAYKAKEAIVKLQDRRGGNYVSI